MKIWCLLHSSVREGDGYNFENTLTVGGFYGMPTNSLQGGRMPIIFLINIQIIL
jgi:hypothetical protein